MYIYAFFVEETEATPLGTMSCLKRLIFKQKTSVHVLSQHPLEKMILGSILGSVQLFQYISDVFLLRFKETRDVK